MAEEQVTAPAEASTQVAPTPVAAPVAAQTTTAEVTTTPVAETDTAPEAEQDDYSWVNKKYIGKDGKPDFKAMAKSNDVMEKAIGKKGALPPSTIDDYVFEGSLQYDEEASKAFKEKAHKAGFSTAQYKEMMGWYEEEAGRLIPSVEKTTETLSQVWGSDYEANVKFARQAAAYGLPPDVTQQELLANPLALRILSRFGADMQEDQAPPLVSSAAPKVDEDAIKEMMNDPDYYKNNARGKELQAKVDSFYSK